MTRPGLPIPRPAWVSLALALPTLLGSWWSLAGFGVVQMARTPPSAPALQPTDLHEIAQAALIEATAAYSRINVPLGIAQALLGGLLLFACGRAWFGRPASPGLVVQSIVANVALLIVTYVLQRPMRIAVANAVVASGVQQATGLGPEENEHIQRALLWLGFRLSTAVPVVVLALAAAALSTPTARRTVTAGRGPITEDDA